MSSNWDGSHGKETDDSFCTVVSDSACVEDALLADFFIKVLSANPTCRFLSMFAFSPSPKRPMNLAVDMGEYFFADDVSMVIGPSTNDRVEFRYQTVGGQVSALGFDNVSHSVQELALALGRWFDEEFAVVFADVLSKKVESVLDMGDTCLLCRKSKATCL